MTFFCKTICSLHSFIRIQSFSANAKICPGRSCRNSGIVRENRFIGDDFHLYWLSEILQKEYEPVRLMKESPRGNIRPHPPQGSGRKFVLRRFRGNAGVYRKLLNFSCENLPQIYEVAEKKRGKSHPGRICRRRIRWFSPAGYFIHRKRDAADRHADLPRSMGCPFSGALFTGM